MVISSQSFARASGWANGFDKSRCCVWKNLVRSKSLILILIWMMNVSYSRGWLVWSRVKKLVGVQSSHTSVSTVVHHFLFCQVRLNWYRGYSLILWIIKTRAEVIDFTYKPWLKNENFLCSSSNMQENETVNHFVMHCPIWANYNFLGVGIIKLNQEECNSYLNGRDWWALGNLMKNTWRERWGFIKESEV